MSGGYLDSNYSSLELLADELEHFVVKQKMYKNNQVNPHLPTGDWDHELSDETLDKIMGAVKIINKTSKVVRLIDYLLAGDTSEQKFVELWEKEKNHDY